MKRLFLVLLLALSCTSLFAQKGFLGEVTYSIDYFLDGEQNGHTDLSIYTTKDKVALVFNSDGESARVIHELGTNSMIVITSGIAMKLRVKEIFDEDEEVYIAEAEKLERYITYSKAEDEVLEKKCGYLTYQGELDKTELCVSEDHMLPIGFLFDGGTAGKSANDKILEKAFITNTLFLKGSIHMLETGQKAILEVVKLNSDEPSEEMFSTAGYQIMDFNR